MIQLRHKRALVMGLGVHGGGLGVARFLAEQGAEVTVTDLRTPDLLRSSIDALEGLPIRYVLGEHREADFEQAELVVKNPGVPASSRFLQIARAAGAAVETEMTLFFQLCSGPILGVTGTKGKTTTTTALGAMLQAQFPDTVVAGNLRVSALAQLPLIGPNTPVALELSSFALENLGEAGLSPRYACVTNLAPDHLDRYGTLEEYGEAKRQIFLHQAANGVLVLNHDDAPTAPWAADTPGSVVWVTREPLAHAQQLVYGDHGLWWHSPGAAPELVAAREDVQLPGAHNLANVAMAAALARTFGVSSANIRRALQAFQGVEHRLEFVRQLDNIRYFNDTAATVPEAAIAALHSFASPLVLICGGADKRLEFDTLASELVARAKAVVLLDGTATPRLLGALDMARAGAAMPPIVGPFGQFEQAILAARELAVAGDTVLLSPGCASFGMFRNEFHRGEEFRRIVGALA